MSSYDHLNPQQREAVLHQGGPLLILAGAGSGKTRVITHRLAELLSRGVPPYRIVAVTFTNKAAGEMRERIERQVPGATQGLWVGTFHALFSRLLRMYAKDIDLPSDFTIFDDQDQKTLVTHILKELRVSEHIAPRAVLSGIDQAKNRGIFAHDYQGKDYFTEIVAKVYPVYQARLRAAKALDFGDLLLLPLQMIKENETFRTELSYRFDYVLVDEFQDVNLVQYQLIRHLAFRTRQLFVVGDDDQAIYGWRGADVQNLLSFEQDWEGTKIIKLEQNYRSTATILGAANHVIARNRDRFGKTLFTKHPGGHRIVTYTAYDERREAAYVVETLKTLISDGIDLTDCAIFYRTNAQSRVLEESLRAQGLPYRVVGGMRFYDRAEVRDIIAYLRVVHHPEDEIALRRIINVPTRGIGDGTVEKIATFSQTHGISLWKSLCAMSSSETELSTGTRKKLALFRTMIQSWQDVYKDQGLSGLAESVVTETGYLERLSLDPGPEATARRENVMELLSSIRETVTEAELRGESLSLVDYLEQISLVSMPEGESKGVCLMTIHAAKGLEFRAVFITGMEEGLFPSHRQQEEASTASDTIEEERRLAYVAMTRAKERLFLSYAKQRRLWGQLPKMNQPSRFLRDIPKEYIEQASMGLPDDSFSTFHSFGEERNEDFSYSDVPSTWHKKTSSAGHNQTFVEYEETQNTRGMFKLGQRVEHVQFGKGEIRAFSGAGESLKLVIAFDSVGPKTVIAKFVSLL